MIKPKINVCFVILNYNSLNYTRNCILSLLEQTYKNYTILVVDNNSVDGSIDDLNKLFPQIKIIRNAENIGFAGGCNIGIRYAIENNFDYVFLLNNDTVTHPQMLEQLLDYADKNSDAAVLTGKIYYQDIPDKIWYAGGKTNRWKSEGIHIEINKIDKNKDLNNLPSKRVTFISGCYMLIPKEIILLVGLFDENFFLYYEDLDYCFRILNKGFSLIYIPRAIIWHDVSSLQRLPKRYFNFHKDTYFHKLRSRIIFLNKNVKGIYYLSGYMFLGFYIVKMITASIIFFRIDILSSILKAMSNSKK